MSLSVNGEKIDNTLIEEEIKKLRPDYQRLFNEQTPQEQEKQLAEWAKENVIENILMHQTARHDKYSVDQYLIEESLKNIPSLNNEALQNISEEQLEEIKKNIEQQLRVDKLIEEITSAVEEPNEEGALNYYNKNNEEFFTPEQVHAAHIVKHPNPSQTDTDLFIEIKKQQNLLNQGMSFEKVADMNSDCPGNGGDLGIFRRGEMVQEFEDIVFNMKPNEISDIFHTEFGYHIAKVLDKIPPQQIPFSNVKDQIISHLHSEAKQEALNIFIDNLKEKAEISDSVD